MLSERGQKQHILYDSLGGVLGGKGVEGEEGGTITKG